MKPSKKKASKGMGARQAKARLVLRKLVDNGGKPIGKAMRKIGYSPAYSTNPHRLFRGKTFQEELQKVIPRESIPGELETLKNLGQVRTFVFPDTYGEDEIMEMFSETPGCVVKLIKRIDLSVNPDGKGMVPPHSRAHVWLRDREAMRAALDMINKCYGSYAPDKLEVSSPLRELSDEELAAVERDAVDKLTKRK